MAKFIPIVKVMANNVATYYRFDHETHEFPEYDTAEEAYLVVKNTYPIDDIVIAQVYEPSGTTSWNPKP